MTMRGAIGTMVAMACVLGAVPAAAQAGCVLSPLAAGADSARAGGGRAPDVLIRATVTAAEVRFRTQPRASVRVPGCAGLDSVVVTERVNLPDPVQPGVTYRDVRVGIEIRTHLNVLCAPALAADPAFAALCAAATPPAASPPAATPPRR